MGKNGHFQRFGLLAPRVTKRTSLFKFVNHPGVLVAKVGYFGVKSAKVHPEQMGTKPAKVGHLAANLLKYVKHVFPVGTNVAKVGFSQKGLRSAG